MALAENLAPSPSARRYVFQEREVTLPVVVRDASSAAATYLVAAEGARRLLPGDDLEVVELLPGRALFSLACIDYRDNDLGDYNEISLAFFVREKRAPRGVPYLGTALDLMRNRIRTYIHRLPVNQSFTCEAGRGIWGFPKTVEAIEFTDEGDRRRCRLAVEGRHVLTFSAARGGARVLPDAAMTTYTYIDGVLHETNFTAGATEVGIHLGGADLVLGDHPIATELRSLGLPRKPLMTVWMGHQHGRFDAPVRVRTEG
jgi:hypothetical protein